MMVNILKKKKKKGGTMKREINDLWTYDEVLEFFNYISSDLTYVELKLLIGVMKLRLLLKKKERTDTHV